MDEWYRTPKGHRRIRYRDDTVERVRLTMRAAKETNINIRYHIREVPYRKTIIPTKGCHSMDDLYRKARRSGLSKREASEVAYNPRLLPPPPDIWWDALHAFQGVSPAEAANSVLKLDCVPLANLVAAKTAQDFRKRARSAWRKILSVPPDEKPDNETLSVIRKLLMKPDRSAFLAEWSKVTELENRVMETDPEACVALRNRAEQHPDMMRLETAVLQLRHLQRKPTVVELAKLFGRSRYVLYREFGADHIRQLLNSLRTDAIAHNEARRPAQKKRTN